MSDTPDSFHNLFKTRESPWTCSPCSDVPNVQSGEDSIMKNLFGSARFDNSPISQLGACAQLGGLASSSDDPQASISDNPAARELLASMEEEDDEEWYVDDIDNSAYSENEGADWLTACVTCSHSSEGEEADDALMGAHEPASAYLTKYETVNSSASRNFSSALLREVVSRDELHEVPGELQVTHSSSDDGSRHKGRTVSQKNAHRQEAASSFVRFRCRCSIAQSMGSLSCLDALTKNELMEIHCLVYGRANQEAPTPSQITNSLHEIMFPLRERSPSGGSMIKRFLLKQKEVCRASFFCAVGGTENARRRAMALTRRDCEPACARAQVEAGKAAKLLRDATKVKTEWASSWWQSHLLTQDFLPNEHAIQYRGLKWADVHKKLFLPAAIAANMRLGQHQWKRALARALFQLQATLYPSWQEAGYKLKLVRSARHSKFPECTDCAKLRTEYVEVAGKIAAAPELVQQRYNAMLEHAKSWQSDRHEALNLRNWATPESDTVYQCDDKCGSFWQKLPVSASGRDTKDNAKAAYHFSIQANVVTGEKGMIRFACVPKNIATGGNFGLTNLLMTLKRHQEKGNLQPHKIRLIRHTDGGPDNVCMTTHIIHWLLVYVGVFEEVLWFRFKAGHSHTEVADRLFSIMKRLFETDSQSRVSGIQDIPELVSRLQAEFHKEKEKLLFEFDFANWDLSEWVQAQHLRGVHTGISSQLVYRYTYCPQLIRHGCVKVQYKQKVSWKGNSQEAEWSPIQRGTAERPTNDGVGLQEVALNESTPNGVIFVLRPPDLTNEPHREAFSDAEFSPGEC